MIKYKFEQVPGKVKKHLTVLKPVVKTTYQLKDLAVSISKRTGIPAADVIIVIEEVKEDMLCSLLDGCNVQLGDIGVFSVELTRNERLEVIPHKVRFSPSFSVQKKIKEAQIKEVK